MKDAVKPRCFRNYIFSEFVRLANNSILWFGVFTFTLIVVASKIYTIILYSGNSGHLGYFSERIPTYLAFMQTNYDISPILYPVFLFIFPIINSIIYSSSIAHEKKYGVFVAISQRLPLHKYFLSKVLVAASISLFTFLYIYGLDIILTLIIYPTNGTAYFTSLGNIFDNQIISVFVHGNLPRNPYLLAFGSMIISAVAYVLYSVITCILAFVTRLKYPALLIAPMILGFLSLLVFEVFARYTQSNVQNFALGRLMYFFLHAIDGSSSALGTLLNIFIISFLVTITYVRLRRAGDVF